MIQKLVHYLPTILIIIPMIVTYIFYKITYILSKNKWRAIHISVQFTAIFYVVAVTIMMSNIFDFNVFSYILIFHIALLAIFLIIQWKTRIEVILRDGLKLLLRLSFLIFLILYVCLALYILFDIIYQNYIG